jgi:hypothetical protein
MLSFTKTIMKTLSILFILIMPIIASAQKMAKPQIDKSTNDTTFFTTTEKIARNKGALSPYAEDIESYMSTKKGVMILHLKIELTTEDHHRFEVSPGNPVWFKLADNSIINFSNISYVQASREGVGPRITGRLCWTAEVAVNVVKGDISKISSSAVKVISVQTNQKNIDFDVKEKYNDVIKKAFVLILAAK